MNKSKDCTTKHASQVVAFALLGDVCRIKTGESVSKSEIHSNQGNFQL